VNLERRFCLKEYDWVIGKKIWELGVVATIPQDGRAIVLSCTSALLLSHIPVTPAVLLNWILVDSKSVQLHRKAPQLFFA